MSFFAIFEFSLNRTRRSRMEATHDFLLRLRLQPQSVNLAIKTLELIPDLQAHIMHLIGRQPTFTSSIFDCYGAVLFLLKWRQLFSIDVLVEVLLSRFRL